MATGSTVNLASTDGTSNAGDQAAGDRFIDINGVFCSAHDDKLLGNDHINWMFGSDGDDRLEGGLGQDTLMGAGDDDALVGGADNDELDGGDGKNMAIF